MNILDLILSRRTVHNYNSDAVSREVIQNAIEAAIHAPNHKQTWPWKFFLAGPKVRSQLAVLQADAKAKKAAAKSGGEVSEALKKSLVENFMKPGALLVLGMNHSDDAERAKEDYASLACAVQNMSLYLAAEGFGTKWSTGKVTQSDQVYAALGVKREDVDLCGWLWIGHADGPVRKPERPPLHQFIQYLD